MGCTPRFRTMRTSWQRVRPYKNLIVVFLVPLLLLPLILIGNSKEAKCGAVVIYMGILWVTEAVPLAVTAMVPIIAFPILSIDTAQKISMVYLSDSNFIFFGSMVMSAAVENSHLHERIALRVLNLTGPNPRRLLFGFQLATCFISLWISNTGTTAMMVPIVLAVIAELERCRRCATDIEFAIRSAPEHEELDMTSVPERQHKMYKGLLLAIAFSASIGGTGTLIGTGANVVLSGCLQKDYGNKSPITFASWMLFAIPGMVVLLIIAWVWLQAVFIGFGPHEDCAEQSVRRLLRKKYEQLGPTSFEEKSIIVSFVVLVLLWIFRRPEFMPGWGQLFPDGYVTDGTTAMSIALLLFVLPAENVFAGRQLQAVRPIMTWKVMKEKFAWSTVLLIGGGYGMAAGVENSGLSDFISQKLSGLESLPRWLFLAIACLMVNVLTEFSSNVATSSIFVPMVQSIAEQHNVNPLYYMLPVTLASSYAFMFPAGVPPNAIVFDTKLLSAFDMFLGGSVINVAAFILIQVYMQTYARLLYDLDTVPAWAQPTATPPVFTNSTH